MVKAFVVLISAHLMADYFLQTDWMANNKGRAAGLLSHSLVHVITSFVYLWSLSQWPICLSIGLVHTFLDYTKNRIGPAWGPFVVDQIFHTASIAILVAIFGKLGHFDNLAVDRHYLAAQVFSGGFIASVWGIYYFLFKFAPKERLNHSQYLLEKVLRGVIFASTALTAYNTIFALALFMSAAAHAVFSIKLKTFARASVSIPVTVLSALLALYALDVA